MKDIQYIYVQYCLNTLYQNKTIDFVNTEINETWYNAPKGQYIKENQTLIIFALKVKVQINIKYM